MCGISVIISKKKNKLFKKILLSLYQIKHRGYDSIGILLLNNNLLRIYKEISTNNYLALHKLNKINDNNEYNIGIGHNRMANIGDINIKNTHPIISKNKKIFIVHNGNIDNYCELNKKYFNNKYENDTKIIVELVSLFYNSYNNMELSINKLIKLLKGSYGLIIFNIDNCDKIYIIKYNIPLLIGYKNDDIYITSEVYGFCNNVDYYKSFDDNKLYIINKNYCIDNFHDINTKKYYFKNNIINLSLKTNYTVKEFNKINVYIKKIIDLFYVNKQIVFHNIDKKLFNYNIELNYYFKNYLLKNYFNFLFKSNNFIKNKTFYLIYSYFGDNVLIYEKVKKIVNKTNNYLCIINNKHSHIGKISGNNIICNIGREKTLLSIKPILTNIIVINLLYMFVYNDYKYISDLLNLSNYFEHVFNKIKKICITKKNINIKYNGYLNKIVYYIIKKNYEKHFLIYNNDNYDIYISDKYIIINNIIIELKYNFFNFLINYLIIHYLLFNFLIKNNINPDIPIF